MSFSFIQNPTGQAMTDGDLVTSALDQPMSLGSTFWDQAKGGVLESFGLGTGIRNFSTPEAAPEEQTNGFNSALQSINRAIDPAILLRRTLGTAYDGSATINEDQYKQSPSYRADIPWSNGMTEERAAALAEQDDVKKVREFYGQKRPVTAFFGNLGGQAVDPINYIPIFGEAVQSANVARFGRVAGRALTASADAAANTAIAGLTTAGARGQFGDDVSWQSTVSQIAMAALIGGAFGAIHGRFGRATPAELRTEAEAKLSTLDNVQASRVSLNDALDGMIRDSEVNLSPASTDFVARAADNELLKVVGPERVTPEEMRLARARVETDYQFSKEAINSPNPYNNFREVMTDLPENVNEQFQAHGMMASSDGSIAEKRLVGLIESGLDKDRGINSGNPRGGNSGVDSTRTEAPYILLSDKGKTLPETGIKNVVVQGPAEVNLSALRRAHPDINFMTPTEARAFMETGVKPRNIVAPRPAARAVTPASIDSSVPERAPDPAVVDATKRVGKPEASHALAEQYRVNPETGEFPEMADIEQLRAEGRLTEDDIAALDDADEIIKTANAYGEALKSFASCVI